MCRDTVADLRVDLARLLQEQQKEPLDLVWISYYWKQVGLGSLYQEHCARETHELSLLRSYKPCM